MIISLGTLGRLNAPVEDIITFSSKGRPGNYIASDPVLIITFLVVTVLLPPAFKFTRTELLETSFPKP